VVSVRAEDELDAAIVDPTDHSVELRHRNGRGDRKIRDSRAGQRRTLATPGIALDVGAIVAKSLAPTTPPARARCGRRPRPFMGWHPGLCVGS
jgi:hypothetical protein